MGQVLHGILHGSATTTKAVRRAIENSQESLRALAKRYGITPKTVAKRTAAKRTAAKRTAAKRTAAKRTAAKWKKRSSVKHLPTGPKTPHATVLSLEEEAIIPAF